MAYSTATDVRQVLAPEGSQDPLLGAASSLSDTILGEAIEQADAQIDGRLSNRYTVPITADPTPSLLNGISRDIAAYLATLVLYRGTGIAPEHPVARRYARAERMLDQAAGGQLDIVGATAPVEESEPQIANPYEGDLFLPEDYLLSTQPRPPWIMR